MKWKLCIILILLISLGISVSFMRQDTEKDFGYYLSKPPGWVFAADPGDYDTLFKFPELDPVIAGFSTHGYHLSGIEEFFLENKNHDESQLTLLERSHSTKDGMNITISKYLDTGNNEDQNYSSIEYHAVYLLDSNKFISLSFVCTLENCDEYEDDIYYIIHSLRFSE